MFTLPMVAFFGLAMWGFFSRGNKLLIYIYFITAPMVALTILPAKFTAGFSLQMCTAVALMLFVKTAMRPGAIDRMTAHLLDIRRLGFLTFFLVVTMIVTAIAPRLFAGQIDVAPVGKLIFYLHAKTLQPAKTNISQIAYVTISVLLVAAFCELSRTPAERQIFLKALFFGGVSVIFGALLDMSTWVIHPMSVVLKWFKTADYAYLTGAMIGNARRIEGYTPEASAFAESSAYFGAALYFLRHAIEDRNLREKWAPLVGVTCITLTFLSTSSAGYVTVAVFAMMAMLDWFLRASGQLGPNALKVIPMEATIILIVVFVAIAVLSLMPQVLDPIYQVIDTAVFKKAKSSSYEERTWWTRLAFASAIKSYGFGIGAGSTQASNFIAALLAGSGVIGTLAFFSFLAVLATRKARTWEAANILHAMRMAYAPNFVIGLLVGTTMDFGTRWAFIYGLALAVTLPDRQTETRAWRPPAEEPPVGAALPRET